VAPADIKASEGGGGGFRRQADKGRGTAGIGEGGGGAIIIGDSETMVKHVIDPLQRCARPLSR
jgi:hypothetical protein